MEGAHFEEMKTNRSKSERFELDYWKTAQLCVPKEQIIIVQVCKRTMGLCKQIQHLNHSGKPVKIIRVLTNAPGYVSNQTLHQYLKIPRVKDVLKKRNCRHEDGGASSKPNTSTTEAA